jgi:hypothetical protein
MLIKDSLLFLSPSKTYVLLGAKKMQKPQTAQPIWSEATEHLWILFSSGFSVA